MWVIAGVLLGLVLLALLVGFHLGPHAHLLAGVFGLLAAVVLVTMAMKGDSASVLWVLLAGDLTVSGAVGFLAWRGLSGGRPISAQHGLSAQGGLLVRSGAEGVAVSDLDPAGIVRVNGEEWSAIAVNAPVRSGVAVQVVGRGGVRLEVWGEELPPFFGDVDAAHPGKEG